VKSFLPRESKWTKLAQKRFPDGRTKEDISKALAPGNTKRQREIYKGLDEIYKRGEGAYYSSGSRPGQTPYSWGQARVYSVLFNGNARKQDADIVEKYGLPLLRG